jgi:hypothetical protein
MPAMKSIFLLLGLMWLLLATSPEVALARGAPAHRRDTKRVSKVLVSDPMVKQAKHNQVTTATVYYPEM